VKGRPVYITSEVLAMAKTLTALSNLFRPSNDSSSPTPAITQSE
jgi:hypothetical protein